MKTKRLIERLVAGQVKNVRFSDFLRLVESFGFPRGVTTSMDMLAWQSS